MWTVVAALVVGVVALLLWITSRPSTKNLPPGHIGSSILTTMKFHRDRRENVLMKWSKKYGPIFSFNSIGRTVVVLSDPDLIREAFNKAETADRPTNRVLQLLYADKGLVFSSGELWKQSRRFSLHHLRNFGMGRSSLESVIQDQIQEMIDQVVTPNVGKPICIDLSLKIAIVNIIWGIVSGLNKLEKKIKEPIDEFMQPEIDEHERTVDLEGEPRDYIDCMLQERSRNPELFTNRHMLRSIMDLFIAGYDTTTSTLRWAFIYLCRYPEVQRKVREEITKVIGTERRPTLADRGTLPYTEAFIMETQRVANIGPSGVEHMTRQEIQLGGYTIPRGTKLISLLIAVHMDEKHFPEPEAFRPERFLDEQGRVKPSRALMPFSVGKRSCLGEALARGELFLFVTELLQRYSLRFPDGFSHDLSCDQMSRLIRKPTPYELVIENA